MKKLLLQFVLLIIIFSLSGCAFPSTSSSDEECTCCTEDLLASDPIQDLIDGNNQWMGIELGTTEAQEIEEIFDNIPHEFCYWKQDEDGSRQICGDIPDKHFANIGGYIFVYLTEFNCRGFKISWDLDKINNIVFSCGECVNVEQIISLLGEPSYISSWLAGLHDSELITTLYYPQRGLSVGLEILDPLDPQITQSTTVSYFELALPTLDDKRSTVKDIISGLDYECLQEWVGFGNIVDLYYSEEQNPNCPSE